MYKIGSWRRKTSHLYKIFAEVYRTQNDVSIGGASKKNPDKCKTSDCVLQYIVNIIIKKNPKNLNIEGMQATRSNKYNFQ